jgi:ElaB/YqjD/DUF883 family membrane-anchored ribosome-binding protein
MSLETIEGLDAEVAATRARIASNVKDLRHRTDPETLAGEAMELAATQGKALVDKARTLASAHPLALGAGVAAFGLALFTRHKLSHARVDLGDDSSSYTDYDDSYPTPTSRAHAASPDTPLAGQIGNNPLLSIILGLAAGALIGALVPSED